MIKFWKRKKKQQPGNKNFKLTCELDSLGDMFSMPNQQLLKYLERLQRLDNDRLNELRKSFEYVDEVSEIVFKNAKNLAIYAEMEPDKAQNTERISNCLSAFCVLMLSRHEEATDKLLEKYNKN